MGMEKNIIRTVSSLPYTASYTRIQNKDSPTREESQIPILRPSERPFRRFFRSSYILLVHLLLVSGMSATILLAIPGLVANDKNSKRFSNGHYLQTSDVATAIAAGLVLVRITTASWSSMVAWRCVYILLEKDRLDLRQLNTIISWKIYPTDLFGRSRKPKRTSISTSQSRSVFRVWASIVLVLMWPASLGAPLLTSAVNWDSDHEFTPRTNLNPHSGNHSSTEAWRLFQTSSTDRRNTVVRAVSNVGRMTMNTNGLQLDSCRHVVSVQGLEAGAKVENDVFPCIETGDIKWSSLPSDIEKKLHYTRIFSLINTEMFVSGQIGAVALFDLGQLESALKFRASSQQCGERLNSSSWTAIFNELKDLWDEAEISTQENVTCGELGNLPNPAVFTGKKHVILFTSEYDGSKCGPVEANFGELPAGAIPFSFKQDQGSPCFIAGEIDIVAGVMKSAQGTAINTMVADVKRRDNLDEDPWVNEALVLLPDVMNMLGLINMTTTIERWRHTDNYVKSAIQYAYSATWDAMDQKFNPNDHQVSILTPIQIVVASVRPERVYAWLAINLLFTISGVLQWLLQQKCERPVVIDTAAVAITTDASQLLTKESKGKELGWRSMSYVTKPDAFDDGGARIGLQLEHHKETGWFALKESSN